MYKTNKKFIVFTLIFLLSVCAWSLVVTPGEASGAEGNDNLVLPEAGYGMVYVTHPTGLWPQFKYYVYVDETVKENMIGSTVGGQFLPIQLTPGEHIIYSVGENTKYIKIDVKEGNVIFVQQNEALDSKDGSNQDNMEMISEIKGKLFLKHATKGWVAEH